MCRLPVVRPATARRGLTTSAQITVSVTVGRGAAFGARSVTVVNVDGGSRKLVNALTVI